MDQNHFDVLIAGAGISGIGAAYHLQANCPKKTYAILEARERLGGTWDHFRYPGIRSDSDMYTLGYAFRPWTNPKSIADGPSILAYVRETAEAYGIDRRIRYRQRIERAIWSSRDAKWTVEALDTATGDVTRFTCNFLFMCCGYFDYAEGYTPEFEGRDRFRGRVVHPHRWPSDVDYEGKRVVIIGSGATAVTLLPELAKRAAHVTMLQRSPTYILSVPGSDPVANWLRARVPLLPAYAITRWKNVILGMAFYNFCKRFPERAKKLLVGWVEQQLGGKTDVKHFTPSYKPWDQRLCLAPDGDLFVALYGGRASVVTDHVESFTETGLLLRSGQTLEADLIVTATGLKLKFLGGVELTVDGRRVTPNETMAYKGMMCSGVPNMALSLGYTNASWTLKCDLTSQYVCRLLNYMDRHGYTRCCPERDDRARVEQPVLDLTSGYVLRSVGDFPRQGALSPWRLYQNYALDRLSLRHKPVADGALEFGR